MDALSIHLILNHIPVVGGVGALLLLAWGVLRRSHDVTGAALGTYVIVALIAIPVFVTGGEAALSLEGSLDGHPGLLHQHRDAAVAALVGLVAAAATALATLFAGRSRKTFPMFPTIATLILGLAAAALLVRTASLGGQIRHGELRSARAAVATDGR